MPKADVSGSDTEEKESNSSSDELENPIGGGSQKMTEYEKQRMKRIEENRARMEALGLPKLGSSLMGSARNTKTKRERNTKTKREPKGKAKVTEEEDEEYRPPAGEDAMSSSSDDEEETSGSRTSKVKKKHSRTKKKIPIQKLMSKSDFVDDDEALMQAIALSLKDFAECSDLGHSKLSQSVDACLNGVLNNERRGNALIQEGTTKRKRKKMVSSRVQMTEDELVVHFFQFDEAGKGTITLRDLRRVAAAHDFMWSDNEMADMIYCFDSDGDGKLNLDDFRKIVGRCNMIKSSEGS
ncbi:uncharacterized protein LOC127786465 isoform X2 [Diospyros lotus]|uniref:uncharacterized protein LOC127786465 isoform X2 n=1 Tax=Diospyros lotus TaxID=55363 RepID=UPI0022516A2A|nr:uncharacterized protein LOC127786465 isoform X2 [Diospyros lotus]